VADAAVEAVVDAAAVLPVLRALPQLLAVLQLPELLQQLPRQRLQLLARPVLLGPAPLLVVPLPAARLSGKAPAVVAVLAAEAVAVVVVVVERRSKPAHSPRLPV
jgi:hypothetical protein